MRNALAGYVGAAYKRTMIPFPEIDPVAIHLGPLPIRWYALAYIAGIVLGWLYIVRLAKRPDSPAKPNQVDDFVFWATLGIILGGRLGYVIFYKPGYFLQNPAEILATWQGGMSFHGGMLGMFLAMYLYGRKVNLHFFDMSDLVAQVTPIGLFFGRMANFINGELWGRPTDVAWAMVFPNAGSTPRHPSQLYEAGLEGIALFLLLLIANQMGGLRRRGLISGLFLIGYGLARIIVEFFREPDAFLGFLYGGATMGQLLSLPMVLAGIIIMFMAKPRAAQTIR